MNKKQRKAPTPCPFCGSKEIRIKFDFVCVDPYYVCCAECEAQGPVRSTRIDSIKAWEIRIKGKGTKI